MIIFILLLKSAHLRAADPPVTPLLLPKRTAETSALLAEGSASPGVAYENNLKHIITALCELDERGILG